MCICNWTVSTSFVLFLNTFHTPHVPPITFHLLILINHKQVTRIAEGRNNNSISVPFNTNTDTHTQTHSYTHIDMNNTSFFPTCRYEIIDRRQAAKLELQGSCGALSLSLFLCVCMCVCAAQQSKKMKRHLTSWLGLFRFMAFFAYRHLCAQVKRWYSQASKSDRDRA